MGNREKHGKTEENVEKQKNRENQGIEKHWKTGGNRGERRKARKNGENQGKHKRKHGKTERIRGKDNKTLENREKT